MNPEKIKQLLPYIFRKTVQEQTPTAAIIEIMSAFHEPAEALLARLDALFNPARLDEETLLPAFMRQSLNAAALAVPLQEIVNEINEPHEAAEQSSDSYFEPQAEPVQYQNARREMLLFLAHWVDLTRVLASSVRPAPLGIEEKPILAVDEARAGELIASAHWFSKWRGTEHGLIRFLEMITGLSGFTITVTEPFHVVIKAPRELWVAPDAVQLAVRVIEEEKPAHITYELTS